LRDYLQHKLPEYMIPAAFVALEALPLTPNGKVDRRALPAPDGSQRGGSHGYVAPRTPEEELLAGIWESVLRIDRVGIHDNFFELGGHSLLATQVISRMRDALVVELPLSRLFEAPTVAGLIAHVNRLREERSNEVIPPLAPTTRDGPPPLSFAQERLWFFDQFEPQNAAYNIPWVLRLEGRLNVSALERSLQELVRRHEVLRTSFASRNGQPQLTLHDAGEFQLIVTDLQNLPASEREGTALHLAATQALQPFDLAHDLMLRARLWRTGEREQILALTVHHIAADGWSFGVLFRELAALYHAFASDQPVALPELPVQYADFAVWQRGWLQGPALDRQLAYWKDQLADAPAVLELPTDFPRPAAQTYRGRSELIVLNETLTRAVHMLSRREGVTPFMTLLTAFQVLLSRYSGQDDVSVGAPIAGRNRTELEGLIGFFVNTLVLRTDLSGNPTFQELLRQVRETTLAAYAHQDVPFEKLVAELQPQRNLSHSPLFQVMFMLQNVPSAPVELTGLTVVEAPLESSSAKFDLTLALVERQGTWEGTLNYNADLFAPETMVRLIRHLTVLLEGIVADPGGRIGNLPWLTPAERQQILVDWNDTHTDDLRETCVHELIEAQVRRSPDAVAVAFEQQSLTYCELDAQANRLARYLVARGVGPDVLVGLCVERSPQMVTALVAILKAGGAYVPLDPAYPAERIRSVLADAKPLLVLTQTDIASRFNLTDRNTICLDVVTAELNALPDAAPSVTVPSSNLAYVIYTSGSTGQPKGVQIPHRALVNLLRAMAHRPGLASGDVLLAVTTIAFDIAALELFLPLTVGARVVLAARDDAGDGQRLKDLLGSSGTTVMQATPATWRLLLAAGWEGASPLKILCGGEALPRDLADELLARSSAVWNMYGPTETTVWSAVTPVVSGLQTVAIGPPIANTTLYVLDRYGQPVPNGVPGELYIGGDGLARGYLNQPELTEEKFVANPFGGSHGRPDREDRSGPKLYRTGDLVRRRADGNLEFLGRLDHQVKLRGFRIELGEIEAVLTRHGHVAQAVAVLREDRPGNRILVAYAVAKADNPGLTAIDVRRYLQSRLPEYMVPTGVVFLDALPLTANGKVDRRALPVPQLARHHDSESNARPMSTLESTISRIFCDVLEIGEIGLDDDFFELGGNSLLAVQVQSRIGKDLLVRLPLRKLFESPNIRGLAKLIIMEIHTIRGPETRPVENAQGETPTGSEPTGESTRPPSRTRRAYRFLALSDHAVARSVRAIYRAAGRASLPAPGFLFKPIRWAFIGLRFVVHFLTRVFVCEPIFKSYCRQVGRNFHTGIYLPWVQGKGDIIVGDNVTFDGKCAISFAARFSENPTLTVGDRTGIGHDCMFTVGKQITIGKRCRIASDVWIFDSGGHPLDPQDRAANLPMESQAVRPVEIGDDVWIGRRCVIFPGVTIGKGSVLVPSSVVMSSVPPYSLVSGHPAKVVAELQPLESPSESAN
jgi:amino acid adenylation domain-containing protein